MKSVQVRTRWEGGLKLGILLRTYFMDDPLVPLLYSSLPSLSSGLLNLRYYFHFLDCRFIRSSVIRI